MTICHIFVFWYDFRTMIEKKLKIMERFRTTFGTRMPELFRSFDDLFDEYENPKKDVDFSVEIPLPGLDKENINIEVIGRKLIIKTKITEPFGFIKRFNDNIFTYYLSEYHDLNNIFANMKNGLLTIKVPIKEKKVDSIKIEVK